MLSQSLVKVVRYVSYVHSTALTFVPEAVEGVGSGGRGCCEVEGEAADGRCSPCPGNPPMDEEAGDM